MKRYISALLACLLVFSLAACGKEAEQEAATESVTEAAEETTEISAEELASLIMPTTETTVPPTTQKSDTKQYKKEYAAALRKVLDNVVGENRVYAAAVVDPDGDGIPAVMLSLDASPQHIVDLIINYRDGKMVAGQEVSYHPEGTDVDIAPKTFYVEGTDYFVFRALGTCAETAEYNEFDLYTIEDGKYVKVMHYSHDCSEAAQEPGFADNWGFASYQGSVIIPEFDSMVREKAGMGEIVDCSDFFTYFDEDDGSNKHAEKWLEKQLDVKI